MSEILESYASFARYLSQATGTEVKAVFSRNMTAELQRTRTGSADILLGPAHMIGSALRYGYEPVATFSGSQKMVFVIPQTSAIKSLDDAKGKNLFEVSTTVVSSGASTDSTPTRYDDQVAASGPPSRTRLNV